MSSRTILLILRNNVYLRLKISNAILALLLLIMSNRPHVQCEVEGKTKHMHEERTKYSVWQLMHIDKQLLPFQIHPQTCPVSCLQSYMCGLACLVAISYHLVSPYLCQLFPLSSLTSDLPHSIPVLNYYAAFYCYREMCSSHPFKCTNGNKGPSLRNQGYDPKVTFSCLLTDTPGYMQIRFSTTIESL